MNLRTLLTLLSVPIDLIVSLLYGIIAIERRVFGPRSHASISPPEKLKSPLLVLVHGFGANDVQFLLARCLLRPLPSVCVNLSSESIETSAQELEDFVEQLHHQNVESIVLVGVSMGGLVAAWYAENRTRSSVKILGIVTVGSPFRGAPLLRRVPAAWKSTCHCQMTPNSAFQHKLAQQIAISTYSYQTVGSRADFQVPDEYSSISKPPAHYRHVSFPFPGHMMLTSWPTIWRCVQQFVFSLFNVEKNR